MKPLTKVIIPVAGLGTRMLPASKALPKEMLSVVDKPAIEHVVAEAVAAGFQHIILVTRQGKSALEDHFDRHFELEHILLNAGKHELLASIQCQVPDGITLSYVRQPQPLGLGHAILCANTLIGSDDFAVMLPDMLIHNQNGHCADDLVRMLHTYQQTGLAQIMVEAVPPDQLERYGIVACSALKPGECAPIHGLVEKPRADQAPTNFAIIGRYILPAQILNCLAHTEPDHAGEIQLTDALQQLLSQGVSMQAYRMQGHTFDCGSKLGYLQANLRLALDDPDLSAPLWSYINQLVSGK